MQSRERRIRRLFKSKGCDFQKKLAYDSWREADTAAKEYRRRHRWNLYPYKCIGCRRWHLTRKLHA